METLHPWWDVFGEPADDVNGLASPLARRVAEFVAMGRAPGVTLRETRQSPAGIVALYLEVEVERPQDLALPIRAVEPVAVVVGGDGDQPTILALRPDFPATMHQNWSPEGMPYSLCIDDRPWVEARLTFTPADFIKRIQLWLSKAARGELYDPAQPLEPLFFTDQISLVIPTAALLESAEPMELVGFLRPDNPNVVITYLADRDGKQDRGDNRFVVVALRASPQGMRRMRHAPSTLLALHNELEECGNDLLGEIKARVSDWASISGDKLRRISSRIAIIIAFPVTGPDGQEAFDLRGFVTEGSAGEVGVALGLLEPNTSDVGSGLGFVRRIMPGNSDGAATLQVGAAKVYTEFDRAMGAAVSGQSPPDLREVVLIGAGSLGSQLAINLCREGRFKWTVVDDDDLLPHNLARHALYPIDTGAPKACALAHRMHTLLGESVNFLRCNVLAPPDELKDSLAKKLASAEIILDASASVAASRHLADLPDSSARRVSVFFNPSGTAVVLLAEGTDRAITVHDLEAQYHRLVQLEPALAGHLRVDAPGLRYSGSCRTPTNRIPASRAAMLSAIAAAGITRALEDNAALISVWTLYEDGAVGVFKRAGATVSRVPLSDWTVTYDDTVSAELAELRARELPSETGGILLGMTDAQRHTIHIVRALPQPPDSSGTNARFERGVVGLPTMLKAAAESSLDHVRYVGEWHSHPARTSTNPSSIDLCQLAWLAHELDDEGLPALMAIVGDDGACSILLGRSLRTSGERDAQERGT